MKALSREKIHLINIGEYMKMNSLHEIENLNREHKKAVKHAFGFLNLSGMNQNLLVKPCKTFLFRSCITHIPDRVL